MILVALMMYPMSLPTVLLVSDAPYEKYVLSLPVSRFYYILSKYIGHLLFSFVLIIIGVIYGYLMNTYVADNSISFNQLFSFTGIIVLVLPVVLMSSLTFPIFFKFSKTKGSIVLILFFIFIFIVVILGLVYAEENLNPGITYSDREIFPVLMHYLVIHIEKIGEYNFFFRIIIGTLLTFFSSLLLSVRIIYKKNIGGA
jgi:ABC-type transport system involved in multi-copper enzyme maturation permease subunit